MKIWIDLINASHVLFFYSLLKDINQKNITFTVRDRAETVNLAKSFGLNATIVGKYRMNNIKKS